MIRRLTPDQIAWAVTEYESGRKMVDVAAELNVHWSTLGRHLKRAGVVRPQSMTADQIAQAARLRATGMSFAAIGRQLGFSADAVSRRLRRNGSVA